MDVGGTFPLNHVNLVFLCVCVYLYIHLFITVVSEPMVPDLPEKNLKFKFGDVLNPRLYCEIGGLHCL